MTEGAGQEHLLTSSGVKKLGLLGLNSAHEESCLLICLTVTCLVSCLDEHCCVSMEKKKPTLPFACLFKRKRISPGFPRRSP